MDPTRPESRRERDPERAVRTSSVYLSYSSLGLQFGLTILLFTWAGSWLDGRYGCSPWGTIGGAGLGFLGATVWLYNQIYAREGGGRGRRDG